MVNLLYSTGYMLCVGALMVALWNYYRSHKQSKVAGDRLRLLTWTLLAAGTPCLALATTFQEPEASVGGWITTILVVGVARKHQKKVLPYRRIQHEYVWSRAPLPGSENTIHNHERTE